MRRLLPSLITLTLGLWPVASFAANIAAPTLPSLYMEVVESKPVQSGGLEATIAGDSVLQPAVLGRSTPVELQLHLKNVGATDLLVPLSPNFVYAKQSNADGTKATGSVGGTVSVGYPDGAPVDVLLHPGQGYTVDVVAGFSLTAGASGTLTFTHPFENGEGSSQPAMLDLGQYDFHYVLKSSESKPTPKNPAYPSAKLWTGRLATAVITVTILPQP